MGEHRGVGRSKRLKSSKSSSSDMGMFTGGGKYFAWIFIGLVLIFGTWIFLAS